MNIKEANLGEKLIMGGFILSIVALFMPWVDAGFVSADGFQQQGYFITLLLLYPAVQAAQQKMIHKVLAYVLVGISLAGMIYMIASKTIDIFGTSVNLAASGMYITVVALIIIIVGNYMNNRMHPVTSGSNL